MRSPITKEGYSRLQLELEDLKKNKRPQIIQAIAEARAHGDLSENAEYHSAKEKQGYIEARINLLENLLSSSDIFDPTKFGVTGRCLFSSYVKLRDENDNILTYRLVNEFETDFEKNHISATSPLGKALIGKSEGEITTVFTPKGEVEYEILSIHYESEEGI